MGVAVDVLQGPRLESEGGLREPPQVGGLAKDYSRTRPLLAVSKASPARIFWTPSFGTTPSRREFSQNVTRDCRHTWGWLSTVTDHVGGRDVQVVLQVRPQEESCGVRGIS